MIKLLKIDPNHVNALNNKGLALNNLGKYEEAIDWFDKALEIDPIMLMLWVTKVSLLKIQVNIKKLSSGMIKLSR